MRIRNLLSISIAIIVACLTASAVYADDFQWIEAAGGNFGDSDNWNPAGPPDIADRAMFELPDIYTVTFDNDYTNDRLFIDSGDVTFDLSSYAYHLEFSEPEDDSVVIGHIGSARLSINSGTVESRNCTLGRNENSMGEIVVSTDGHWVAFKEADGWHSIQIGHVGEGKLTVENGGEVRQGAGAAASQPGSQATITVAGADSQWYVDGWFGMAESGRAELNASGGSYVHIGRCEMAINPGSYAKAVFADGVPDDATEWNLTSFWETSLTIGQRGSATVELRNNATLINDGNLAIAAYPASYGRLSSDECGAHVRHSLSIGGTPEAQGGTGIVELVNHACLTVGQDTDDKMLIWPAGTIYMNEASIEMLYGENKGNVILNGTLAGWGMIWANVINQGGTMAPGTQFATHKTLEIGADYTQDSTGTLKIEIAGPELDTEYSQLYVSNGGTAQIGGLLQVVLLDGYIPTGSDSFIIVSAPDGLTGEFINTAGGTYTFSGGTFDVFYNPDSVILTNYRSEPACAHSPRSDFSGDCKVDFFDFAILANEWLDCGLYPSDACD